MRSRLFLEDEYVYDGAADAGTKIVCVNETYYRIYITDVSDLEGYDSYNASKIVYEEWNGTSWVNRTVLEDNKYSDVAFDVYAEGNRLYIAYTQQNRKLTMKDVEDPSNVATGLAIKYADLSKGMAKALPKTVDHDGATGFYKYNVQITRMDGVPMIVWAENTDNNVFGVSPHNYLDEETNAMHVYETVANSVWVCYMNDGVGITEQIGESAKSGSTNFLYLISLITINLGVMNLLPIPALDGGRLTFQVIEVIRRKPVSEKVEGIIHSVGIIVLMALMLIIAMKDTVGLFR
jgi:hypothetical protein